MDHRTPPPAHSQLSRQIPQFVSVLVGRADTTLPRLTSTRKLSDALSRLSCKCRLCRHVSWKWRHDRDSRHAAADMSDVEDTLWFHSLKQWWHSYRQTTCCRRHVVCHMVVTRVEKGQEGVVWCDRKSNDVQSLILIAGDSSNSCRIDGGWYRGRSRSRSS